MEVANFFSHSLFFVDDIEFIGCLVSVQVHELLHETKELVSLLHLEIGCKFNLLFQMRSTTAKEGSDVDKLVHIC